MRMFLSKPADMLADEIVKMPPDRSCVLDMSKHSHTLDEIGKAMGITRERVRQIEDGTGKKGKNGGAIGKLRHARRRHYLESFLGEGETRGPDLRLDVWDRKQRREE